MFKRHCNYVIITYKLITMSHRGSFRRRNVAKNLLWRGVTEGLCNVLTRTLGKFSPSLAVAASSKVSQQTFCDILVDIDIMITFHDVVLWRGNHFFIVVVGWKLRISYRLSIKGCVPTFRDCQVPCRCLRTNKVFMLEMYELKLILIRGCGAISIDHWNIPSYT